MSGMRFSTRGAQAFPGLFAAIALTLTVPVQAFASVAVFESGQTRPLALSADGTRLYAVNTPDHRLEVFSVSAAGLSHLDSVPVGLEPVAVAARPNAPEVWVVNHLSDSVSVVDVSTSPPRVVRTLLVGDTPSDVVFAGPGFGRAFVSAAHRGQNSLYTDPANPGELTTPGIGRADVWVFDADAPGPSLGGDPLTVVTLFGDTPRALAATPGGDTVYAAIFKSGNRTTVVNEGAVCDGGATAAPCIPEAGELTAPGGLPAPNSADGLPQPEVGLIVRFDGTDWMDELGRSWNDMVRFDLPDQDVFAIPAGADPEAMEAGVTAFAEVGTVLFNIAVHPSSGKIYISNTEARNEVRFEGSRAGGSSVSTVQGHLHEARITVIDPGASSVVPRHLNKHIDYSVSPAPAGVRENSLATPVGMAISSDGSTLYVAALGSDKIGIFDVGELDSDTFVPSSASHVDLNPTRTGGDTLGEPLGAGPTGLVLDEDNGRLYALRRFDNAVSVVDLTTRTETARHPLHNPEPASVTAGRRFLYDAFHSSSNGEASCAGCHVFADKDELAWDLGDPDGTVLNNPNPFTLGPVGAPDFHPMKGPMTTQTLRGMDGHGPMHWRGDRTAGNDPGGDPLDEAGAFEKFNPAFVGLLGREAELADSEMQAYTDFILQVTHPPNPIRALDDSLTFDQAAGRDFYFNVVSDTLTCNGCHVLDPSQGFFGTDGNSSFEGETQHFKIPQLVNMYEKVGMFGMPDVPFIDNPEPDPLPHMGDQIRGFGFTHDGSVDTLLRFHRAVVFAIGSDTLRRQIEQFSFAFDAPHKPVVGQQVTLDAGNGGVAGPRIDLLIAQSSLVPPASDLVVKGTIAGEPRGWHLLPDGTFESDKASEAPLSDGSLRALAASAGQELTYTAVPAGSGVRLGVDRDDDASFDGDDCAPTDPAIHPAAPEQCSDGIDNDCDGLVDDADPDCQCGSGGCDPCGNGTCDAGESSCTCAVDCGAPPANEDPFSTCFDGEDNDCDGLVDLADPDCCLPAGTACTQNGQCCSNRCRGPQGGRTCQ